jgi:hypothetical protein
VPIEGRHGTSACGNTSVRLKPEEEATHMLKSGLISVLGLCAAATLSSVPAAAGGWGCCDCYPYYGYGYGAYVAVAPRVYAYEPRVAYYRHDPRWQYSAAYYNPPIPPAPVYGYAYVNRGPAYLVAPAYPRRWHRRW